MIDVIDYRAGNAPSVVYALEHLGIPCRLTGTPEALAGAERIVLPGVGAARATIDSLEDQSLVGTLRERVLGDGVPFLGICIGLQVLFDHSEEGDVDGLGFVPGRVRRFPHRPGAPDRLERGALHPRAPVTRASRAGPLLLRELVLLRARQPGRRARPHRVQRRVLLGRGGGNVLATQFHAEKSGELGLSLLRNFATWDGSSDGREQSGS
jgi:glutamine amidotransferase